MARVTSLTPPRRVLGAILLLSLAAGGLLVAWIMTGSARPPFPGPGASTAPRAQSTYVGGTTCARCHETETRYWRESDHAKAMEVAGEKTVLGNFNNTTFTYAGVTSTFSTRDGKYFVRTDGPDGQLHDYEIAYTFGYRPLQQYLIAFPGGRYQSLGIAWDTRAKDAGGQRWFHLYQDQKIAAGDPLHWTGANQNWNYMCADCHSTNLQRNFDLASNTYKTTWSEMNTSCEACHGPGSNHLAWGDARSAKGLKGRDDRGLGLVVKGLRAANYGGVVPADIAELKARPVDRPRQQAEVQACAPCHSRRGPITATADPAKTFLDKYRPALLEDGLYHADGQNIEEVYEYGSFTQSKMYAAGVTCSDCHNAHTGKLRGDGNGVCTHCHMPAAFDSPLHTRHKAGTDAAKCTTCHMPTKNYMVVDTRYDHSFRVPRADYTQKYDIPNACTTACHSNRSAAWANDAIVKWYGPTRVRGNEYVAALNAGRRGTVDAEAQLRAAVTNKDYPPIARATALRELQRYLSPASVDALRAGSEDPEAIVRSAAAQTLAALPPTERVALGRPLLNDPVRLVRAWTAAAMAGVPPASLPPGAGADLERATAEYVSLELAVSERPEAHTNLSGFYLSQGRPADAERELQDALRLDPKNVPARVNLADVYRVMGRDADGQRALEEAVALDSTAAEAFHALGLVYVRQKRSTEALAALKTAYTLQPRNARFGYVYAVALHGSGEVGRAITVLEQVHHESSTDGDTLMALALFERDRGNLPKAREWAAVLALARPQDPAASALLAELKKGR